jgi:hypothetical protein
METDLVVKDKALLSLVRDSSLSELIKPLRSDIFLLRTFVAGTSQQNDHIILGKIKDGDVLTLKREPENRFDENAIAVFDAANHKLGYIPEKDNLVFARLMDAGKYITGKSGGVERFGLIWTVNIDLYLVDF